MKKLLVLFAVILLCSAHAKAGMSNIKSLKVVISASITGPGNITEAEMKQQIADSFREYLPKVVLKDNSDMIFEVRYADDYGLTLSGENYGTYYISVVVKSPRKQYDKIADSSKVYWERTYFMSLISAKLVNNSVKTNINSFIQAFAADWSK